MSKPIPHKTIFQVRYKAELKFYDLFTSTAQRLSEYPHWMTNGHSIVLRDFDKHCSLNIKHNMFTYEQDSSDTKMEEKYLQRVVEELPTGLQIKDCTRFGYRRQYLAAARMSFDSLVSVLDLKLLSQDDDLRHIMPPQLSDLMYHLDLAEELYRYHLTVGPVRKKEIPLYINYTRDHHLDPEAGEDIYRSIVEKYPEVAVFIDIDFYREDKQLQPSDIAPFVNTARQKVHGLVDNLCAYLLPQRRRRRK